MQRAVVVGIVLCFLFSATVFGAPSQNTGTVCMLDSGYGARGGVAPSKNSDLKYCKQYSGSTCCTTDTTIFLGSICYVGYGSECTRLLQYDVCDLCHPDVGTGKLTDTPCKAFCDNIYNACVDEEFWTYTADGSTEYTHAPKSFSSSGQKKGTVLFGNDKFAFFANTSIEGDCAVYYDSDPANDPSQTECFNGATSITTNWIFAGATMMFLGLSFMFS